MDWGRRAVARAYAASADSYTDRFADEFSTNASDRALIRSVLEPLTPGSTVLDGGCGPAQLSALAVELGLTPIAVDIAVEMLSVARRRLAEPLLACADLLHLPFRSASFDAVVCWFSVHNLPRDLLPSLLGDVRRVLSSGGRVLLGTHEGTATDQFTDEFGESFCFTYYEGVELAQLLEGAGFTSVRTDKRPPLGGEHQVQKLFASAVASPEGRS